MLLMRVMKIAFIVSALLFLSLVMRIPAKETQPPSSSLEMALTILALTDVVIGYVIPRFILRSAQAAQENAAQPAAIRRWITASVIGFAFLESCSLFGVMLHFLGAEIWRSELLIAVGILATVFFSAGAVPGADGGSTEPR
jgi:membrane protein YqaA with SNARE-associated domain